MLAFAGLLIYKDFSKQLHRIQCSGLKLYGLTTFMELLKYTKIYEYTHFNSKLIYSLNLGVFQWKC